MWKESEGEVIRKAVGKRRGLRVYISVTVLFIARNIPGRIIAVFLFARV